MANISDKGVGYFDPYVHNLATGAVTIADTSNTSILKGVFVDVVMSAHSIAISDGTSTIYTIPASSPAGQRYTFPNTRFPTIIATPSSTAATGTVTYEYEQF